MTGGNRMTTATLYTTLDARSLRLDEIPAARGKGLIWVDLENPTEDVLGELTEFFPIGNFALTTDDRWRKRPKLRSTGDTVMIVGYGSVGDSLALAELDVIVGPGWLITVRHGAPGAGSFDIAPTRQRFEDTRNGSIDPGSALLVILDDVVDGYFDIVESVEDSLEDVEENLFGDDPAAGTNDRVQRELLTMRRNLILLRRRVVPMRDVLLELARGESPWMDLATSTALQTVLDHLLRLVDQIDTQRELLGNVVDAHLALQANSMNEVMKKMTSWAAVLVVATLITGIYGMNFRHMPELGWRFGYPAAIALILCSTGGLWFYFKRKDWL